MYQPGPSPAHSSPGNSPMGAGQGTGGVVTDVHQQQVQNGGLRILDLDEAQAAAMPHVRIVEQPARCALRFRYECEGRSAGSIPGANSSGENKTYPTIQIMNYPKPGQNGGATAVVVVSCVTRDPPYRPHPHNLVGKEGCKKGVCTMLINNPDMVCSFTSLGIQCVKRKDIEDSLKQRELIKVDPFRTGFAHAKQASNIDLNVVRLCFQVFVEGPEKDKFTVPLPPVVSEAIYDKKAMSELVINRLSHSAASCMGGTEAILLCDRVTKDDIQIRFFEERSDTGQLIWEALGDFQPSDVHKQVAIGFRIPRYYDDTIRQPVSVQMQLRRPSDGMCSETRVFTYWPRDLDPESLLRKRMNMEQIDLKYMHLTNQVQQHAGQHVAVNTAGGHLVAQQQEDVNQQNARATPLTSAAEVAAYAASIREYSPVPQGPQAQLVQENCNIALPNGNPITSRNSSQQPPSSQATGYNHAVEELMPKIDSLSMIDSNDLLPDINLNSMTMLVDSSSGFNLNTDSIPMMTSQENIGGRGGPSHQAPNQQQQQDAGPSNGQFGGGRSHHLAQHPALAQLKVENTGTLQTPVLDLDDNKNFMGSAAGRDSLRVRMTQK